MPPRSSQYNARYRFDLTPRQRQVVELIARGHTNPEIAATLGISLDGAKWHVREILAKFEVESREEAAACWRHHQRPIARLARALSPLAVGGHALRWAVLGSAAAAAIAAGVAILVALQSAGGGDDRPSAGASASGTPGEALTNCEVADVSLSTSDSSALTGTLRINLTASAIRHPCELIGPLTAAFASRSDSSVTPTQNLEAPAAVAIAADLTTPKLLGTLRISNWCNDGFVRIEFRAGPATLTYEETDFVTVPGCDGAQPVKLAWEPAPGVESTDPCPVVAAACETAKTLDRRLHAGDLAAVLADARPGPYACPGGPENNSPGIAPLCVGAAAGELRHGFPISRHGSEGSAVSADGLAAEVQAQLAQAAELRLVSIGCETAPQCPRFVVVFAIGSLPQVIYFAYDTVRAPDSGVGPPSLTGFGMSGDNAPTMLEGGQTMSQIGVTEFYPYPR